MMRELFFEDWGASYGSPYLIDDEGEAGDAELAEPAEPFCREPRGEPRREIAFVDGVRRAEGLVYARTAADTIARGVVGAHACGAVVVRDGSLPVFEEVAVTRAAIMGSGERVELPSLGGYAWKAVSIASPDLDAPMRELQRRMREAEGRLAERLSASGMLTVLDGPLNLIRSMDEPVVGYVKTHMRPRLPPELHARVPELTVGLRTPLFLTRQSYSAYLRIAAPGIDSSPWAGIVRLEIPESQGLAAAQARADEVALALPRYAGIAYKDPRAPQNLQPIGALETVLRHRLGQMRAATRAVRLAVAAGRQAAPLAPTGAAS